ncbi:MAG: FTR1 family protein [Rhizobiales bacterium]|nr:FTR1 family protein [Hyphomicrobiales bacterium]
MLVPFLIMLREGVEAALIVGIVASYLVQTGRAGALRHVWAGAALASALSAALAAGLHAASGEFPQKAQELFEAAVALVAVVVLTGMVFWMREAAGSIGAMLRGQVDAAFDRTQGGGRALAGVAFLAVAREGLESAVFLIASFQQEDVGWQAPAGAVLGLVAALATGVAIFRFGRRVDLRRFFRWTGALLIFVAAGLLAGALRSLHEAGVWNHLQTLAWNLSETLPADGVLGTLMAAVLGYRDAPSVGEVALYVLYLAPTLALFLRGGASAAAGAARAA